MPRIGNARANILVFLLIEERRELLRARDRINNVVINLKKNKQTNQSINQSRYFANLLNSWQRPLNVCILPWTLNQNLHLKKCTRLSYLFIYFYLLFIYLLPTLTTTTMVKINWWHDFGDYYGNYVTLSKYTPDY